MYEPREEKTMFDGGPTVGSLGGELGRETGKIDGGGGRVVYGEGAWIPGSGLIM